MKIVLTVIEGPHTGKTFTFDRHEHFIVGRAKFAHVRMSGDDRYFSRVHFLIEFNPPACRLVDLGSRNGTKVNGDPVQSFDLLHGDRIQAGRTVIRVTIEESESQEMTSVFAAPESPPVLPSRPAAVRSAAKSQKPEILRPTIPAAEVAEQVVDIPDYHLTELIGRGAMGLVYRAERLSDQQPVALKIIHPKVAGNARDYQRFLREIDILRQLRHPTIVQLIEAGEANGLLYFSMELVEGVNAQEYLQRQTKLLGPKTAIGIVLRVLEGLCHAHEQGFVHRDVKPSNIMLTRRGGKLQVKLTDFGMARAYAESRLSGLTLTGDICGTPKYMAPEQITDCRRVTAASDQYSVAATLYWLLTGQPTHDFSEKALVALNQVLLDDPIPITERRGDLPAPLIAAIERGLSKDHRKRYATTADFAEALRLSVRETDRERKKRDATQ